jgi:hypothetical protein
MSTTQTTCPTCGAHRPIPFSDTPAAKAQRRRRPRLYDNATAQSAGQFAGFDKAVMPALSFKAVVTYAFYGVGILALLYGVAWVASVID